MDAIETHWEVRSAVYLMHRSIAGPDATLLIGDSITEGFYWNKIGDCSVVNAGFGGINAAGMARYMDILLQDGAPKYAVVMLGSNPDVNLETFRKRYSDIVGRLSKAGTTVILVSIPPVEPEKLLVKRSMDAIAAMNAIIKDEIAAPRGLEYVDLYAKMTINGKAVSGSTTDGIHFTPDSYRVDYKMLDNALQHQIAVTGKPCQ
ncbi:SGNH/GDSL hydrolase family protein [Rhizobium ecuadorense]|uniref:SGNH/GDSL hydrolase family protein n=1 Tax=Rhizobium ecuadorense TaxID=1671795 RepID=UPI0006735293|nr:GDSL-type esterase/lipase family protein [Rhizobium ecuadorense]